MRKLTLLAILCIVPAVTFGADAVETTPAYQVWGALIFQTFEGTFAMIATVLVSIALHKICVKFHLSNEAALKEGLDYALEKGVRSAESWAANKSTKPTGSEKMDQAIAVFKSLATNPALKSIADTQLKGLLEAALHEHINDDGSLTPITTTVAKM